MKNVVLDSLFALLTFKIDFDGTRHLNTSKLSNNYSLLHAKRFFAKKKKCLRPKFFENLMQVNQMSKRCFIDTETKISIKLNSYN